MTSMPVIETTNLNKSYGQVAAVRALSFSVKPHQITAFLGLNGAGKSTTIRMLLGMIRPSSGTGQVLGHRIDDAKESVCLRRKVAYVSENKQLYDYMTVEQLIRFTTTQETLAAVWLLAVTLIMMGGLLRERAVGSSSFTLSLPVTRLRLVSIRIAMGLMEAILLAILPWIAMLFAANVANQTHFIAQASIHVFLLLGGGVLFLAAAFLISSFVEGEYTAPIVSCGALIMLAYLMSDDKLRPHSPWTFMLGSEYFHWRTAQFVGPISLIHAGVFVAIAALMTLGSIKLVQWRDF